ncbi:Cys/Met metabolism PLP-dependent enzyme [Ancylostoma ceylanicum]|uniref:Cys/Met metabolism PLP-dependent enzyme n=1 Tax=Ancylostoma ceylanicum TaxID=53326 RepID=A0A0D6LGX4_9BILA|nr:Cys/Met metabolism PLP-dependent enzyme [Ancylostoma ceylanicum]
MYSGSYSFITETLVRFNVSADFVDVDKEKDFVGAVEKAVKKNTKASESSYKLLSEPAKINRSSFAEDNDQVPGYLNVLFGAAPPKPPVFEAMSEFESPPAVNSARERFGDSFDGLRFESKLSASHAKPLARAQPIVTPIYHSTTYRFDTVEQYNQANHGSNYVYQRCGNPTVENVEVVLRELEQGAATLLYNSGLAACSAVLLEFLNAGDHLICMKPMYSGSYSFITETLVRFNVSADFVDVDKEKDFVGAVEKAVKKNTKVSQKISETPRDTSQYFDAGGTESP